MLHTQLYIVISREDGVKDMTLFQEELIPREAYVRQFTAIGLQCLSKPSGTLILCDPEDGEELLYISAVVETDLQFESGGAFIDEKGQLQSAEGQFHLPPALTEFLHTYRS